MMVVDPAQLAVQNRSFDTLIPDGVPEAANDSYQLLSWQRKNINSG